MLRNLKNALAHEFKGKPLWQQWFEAEAEAESKDITYMSSAAGAVLE